MSKTIPHKAGEQEVFPSPTVVASKALRAESKTSITQDECSALMEELTIAAFAEKLDTARITHILGRLTGNNHPVKDIQNCIRSRIAFQAALNRSACIETGNLLNGWMRISKHVHGKSIGLTEALITSAIAEGVRCRQQYGEEVKKEFRATGRIVSENKIKQTLQERIYKHYFS